MTKTESTAGKTGSRRAFRLPLSVVFFVAYYLYFALEIELHLLYHGAGLIDNFPVFYWGWDFFAEFTTYPGGLLEYLCALLSQLFYYSWAGAAVVTIQAWLMCLCTDYVVCKLGLARWRGLRFVGPLVLLAIYSQYTFHLPETMGVLAAIAAFCLYLRLAPKTEVRAGFCFLALSIGFYVSAGGPYLVFAVLCGVAEILFNGRFRLGAAQLAVGAATPLALGVGLFGQRPHDAYFQLLPLSWKITTFTSTELMRGAVWTVVLFLPLTLLVLGIVGVFSASLESRRPRKRDRTPSRLQSIRRAADRLAGDPLHSRFGLNVRTAALVLATAATLLLYRNPRVKTLFEVDYFSRQEQWSKVVEIGRRNPYHYLVCHAVNRALYRMGRLGDEMFAFPQQPEALLLTKQEAYWQKFDTCVDMGLVNQAQDALMICVETYGERPLLLHRLARVHTIKGNTSTARVFLGALAKVPFWGRQARADLAKLDTDPGLSQDAAIQHSRSIMLRHDFVRNADTLTLLLTENPANRMAYEYGIASLLLSRNIEQFGQNVEKFRPPGVSGQPRHHTEALLLHRTLKKLPIDAPGQTIPREAKVRLHEFFQTLQQHGKNKANAIAALRAPFGDTYYYYYFLGG
ncbi:MAG: DUF6057 family protein [Sedimentisphaerales bacterium]|jgi:hypothetical protein|nr:DUF6057 family protein [Sedimentisphaerales bacterium]HNY77987.1 DUF6057 family protein [Sedimentisphaerales bacterium]HOC63383.1 DUF6057 family protein [Sedimentisphaerales bacterium]HOH64087.1 DUF6057 family protein [Sedimentisphaerales bacterium]HQN33720.1 DUF6057 family protein [Sedimentisphaerales bacterium]